VTNSGTLGTGDVTVDHTASPTSIARLFIRSGVVDAIGDTATLSLAGGGTPGLADQGFVDVGAGINETVGGLKLAGVAQPAGTYGSSLSSATYTNDEFFAGSGIITVVPVSQQPSLVITRSASNIVLSWPTNADNFHVEDSSSLIAPISWQSNATSIVPNGTNYTVTEPSTNSTRFYRLKR
jgi:hypothetical protein